MIQKPIKLRQDQAHPFEVDEMDANLKELDNRTKHDDPQLNTIQLLAEKVVQILLNIPDVSEFETSSQLNSRDTENRKRENHTGTQLAETISDFQAAVLQYAPAGLELGETADKAYRGDRGKTAYDHSQAAHAPADAQKNVKTDWNATEGDAELLNKPNIPSSSDFVTKAGKKLTDVATGGSITNQPIPTNFLRFTNQTNPVILGGIAAGEDGQEMTIWNHSLQAMSLIHDSQSATAPRRLQNLGEIDIELPIDAKAKYRYGNGAWQMLGVFGAGYEPTLIDETTRAVTVHPNGTFSSEEIAEFKVYNESITALQSEADLNILYPDAFEGFSVVCVLIEKIYEMDDENLRTWFEYDIKRVV